jgi:hypothetical protein
MRSAGYYEWPAPGAPFSIQLSFDVIDRLEADIRRSQQGARGRPVETGGVLFGRLGAGGRALYIDDYKPVKCEHRRGASFTLSGADRRRLDRALRKGQVAGFYRTHTRPGLYLDQDDYALIESSFCNPHDVFLLLRPNAEGPAAGGFFFWEEDSIHRQSTFLEFPFRSSEIRPKVEAAQPARKPVRFRHRMRAMQRATVIAGLTLAGLFAAHRMPKPLPRDTAASLPADAAPALWVERRGSDLQVGWDRGAPAVLRAREGVLRITDGEFHEDLHLDRSHLRETGLTYTPLSNQVTFRLELDGGRVAVTESFRLREGPARPAAPEVRAQATRPKAHHQRAWVDDGL